MRGKYILTLLVVLVFLVGCQIPQYSAPAGDDSNKEVKDITKELEQLTEEVTIEAPEKKELTPEEQAREEFKKRLLEKQEQVKAEEAKVEETVKEAEPKAEEAKVEETVKEAEPKAEEAKVEETVKEAEQPKVEVKSNKPEPKTVTTPERDGNGKLTLVVNEGDTIALKLKARDPDGDPLTYTFTKPLDENGKWITKLGDAGRHVVTVSVSDGELTVKNELTIVVNKVNNAPVLEPIKSITVKEGENVVIIAKATDSDGDTLSYTYTGWMTSSSYTTNYNDAGVHEVTVTVSDGIESASQKVTVTVEDVNRAPVLEW